MCSVFVAFDYCVSFPDLPRVSVEAAQKNRGGPNNPEYATQILHAPSNSIAGLYNRYLILVSLLKFDLMFVFLNIAVGGDGVLDEPVVLVIDALFAVASVAFCILGWQAV